MHKRYVAFFLDDGEEQRSVISGARIEVEYKLENVELYVERQTDELHWRFGTPNGFRENFICVNDMNQITDGLWVGYFEEYADAESWTENMMEQRSSLIIFTPGQPDLAIA
ncbi:MAG: hypothetical protein ABH826_04340 [Patescibacteria group bacterium]|nr:hypothetical protein [Patescibacteria group bacterium]